MSEDEIRAQAVRETAAYIDRIHKNGLVPLGNVLADMAAAAYRMEQGMTARGSMRRFAEVRSTDTTPEIGMRCARNDAHEPHGWQMNLTGWCHCDGGTTNERGE